MTTAIDREDAAGAAYRAGLTQLASGRAAAAIDALQRVLTGDPSHPGARRNLIRAHAAAGDHAAVIVATTNEIARHPDSAELHFLRGTAFNGLRRPREAYAALSVSIACSPNFAPAWLNRGNALMDLDQPLAAEAHCRRALSLDPGLIEATVSLGFILTSLGRLPEATAVLEGAVDTQPANVQAHWNLATAVLLAGDLPRGFAEYEWRKRHDRFRHDFIDLPGPVWDGTDPRGRAILVHAEQGLGDTVQFARYLPLIAHRGGTPMLACQPSLIPLLRAIPGVVIVSKADPLPPYDAWIDQMSLPHVFGTTLETIPSAAGYLAADPDRVAAHRATLPPSRRIGLVWAGNPRHSNDFRRTPPPEIFRPLLGLPDCHVISLIPGHAPPGIACPRHALTDYAETAALIAALDLVITVDTSVAHVAGALGCPAWVLLPHAPDWRWLLNKNDTPWYSSLRLFRQPAPGDWRSVMAAIVAALAA